MQTQEIFEKLINNEYINLEYVQPKVKQLNILLKDYFCSNEIFISFLCVTNSGGFPIVFSHSCSTYEILANFYGDEFYNWDETEQQEQESLFLDHVSNFEDLFN